MSTLPSHDEDMGDAGSAAWRADDERYKSIAARLLSELPPRHRSDRQVGPSTEIVYIELDETIPDAVSLVAIELKRVCDRAEGYVKLELPKVCEYAISASSNEGPTLRLTRVFIPFPESGYPRMATHIHVGFV